MGSVLKSLAEMSLAGSLVANILLLYFEAARDCVYDRKTIFL